MAGNGYKAATVELVKETMDLAEKYGSVDLMASYTQMRKNSDNFKMADKAMQLAAELKMGTIDATEAQDILAAVDISKNNENAISISDDWEDEGAMEAKARREMLAKGNQITLPKQLKSIREYIPFLEAGTITSLIAHSGVGKSIMTQNMVDHIALNCNENVLNGSTELTKFIMRCRRIAKITNIPFLDLRRGYWDNQCSAAMASYRGHGQIIDFECGGASPRQIIAEAKRRKAHIVLDYFDMADLSKSKMAGMSNTNQTDIIGYALTEFKEYAVAYNRIIWIVWQVGKEADTKQYSNKLADEQILTMSSAMNSIKARHRSNYGLIMNFPVAKEDRKVKVPWDFSENPRYINEVKGQFSVIGKMTIGKDSFGDASGKSAYIFRDGAKSLIREVVLETHDLSDMTWGKENE